MSLTEVLFLRVSLIEAHSLESHIPALLSPWGFECIYCELVFDLGKVFFVQKAFSKKKLSLIRLQSKILKFHLKHSKKRIHNSHHGLVLLTITSTDFCPLLGHPLDYCLLSEATPSSCDNGWSTAPFLFRAIK